MDSAVTTLMPESGALLRIRACLERFAPRLDSWDIVLFGSRARTGGPQPATPRSDWDLGVRGRTPVPLALFFELEEALAAVDTLDRVELVDLTRASQAFARAVEAGPVVVLHVHPAR